MMISKGLVILDRVPLGCTSTESLTVLFSFSAGYPENKRISPMRLNIPLVLVYICLHEIGRPLVVSLPVLFSFPWKT